MGSQAPHRMQLAPISSFMTVLMLGITLSLPTALSIALDNLKAVGDNMKGGVRIFLYLENGLEDRQSTGCAVKSCGTVMLSQPPTSHRSRDFRSSSNTPAWAVYCHYWTRILYQASSR